MLDFSSGQCSSFRPAFTPTSEALERELANIPEMPKGDLEPPRELTAVLDRWKTESRRLAAHAETEPSVDVAETLPTMPSELRRLADDLDLPVPSVDQSLVDEVQRRREVAAAPPTPSPPPLPPAPQPAKRTTPRVPITLGGLLAVVGVVLVVVGQPIVGGVALAAGVIIAAVSLTIASRVKAPRVPEARPMSVAEPMAPPTPDHELPRLEARLALQQETEAQAQHRRGGAIARLTELGLSPDAVSLRQLAAEGDAAASAQTRRAEWERRRSELEAAHSSASESLGVGLSERGIAIDGGTNLEQAFEDYIQTCRVRADVARQAGRRADLEAQLLSCRAAEVSRDQDAAARATAERQLFEVAQQAGCETSSVDELPDVLREWVRAQEERDKIRQEQDKKRARLDQLLDGVTIDALQAEIAELVVSAGDPPPDDALALSDRSSERERLQEMARQRQETLSELVGKIESAEGHLLDVSQAIEAEARAAAEVSRLKTLEDDLDLTSETLRAAQEKVHADIAPVLNQMIRPWVSRITLGRYDDIRVNPATLGIEAHEAGGQFRAANVLSHGTTEQLFLLLRLALAQRLTTTGEKAPIVLDDITVQSDTDRTMAALDLLHEVSKDHQVVLFSQEDEILRWAGERLVPPSDRFIRLGT